MSNAAVINATATLGRVVGSPITIVTDGTVTPKAYGKGAGAWSATLAFAPVVNGVTGSPLTLTISNNQPANVAQSILTDATSWVGWVVSSVGEFEATGIVEGVTGSDSLSGFLGIYKDDASTPKYAIETGSTAMVAGVSKTWNGSYWIAPAALGGGIVYDGTTYPLPLTAPHKGYKIAVVNPAVPDGWSTLKWTGTGWAPPAGELIAQYFSDTHLTQATPGVQALYKVWQSNIIPDYMIPDLLPFTINAAANIMNAGTPVAGCGLMCGISGEDPTSSTAPDYFLGINNFTPTSGGSGFLPAVSGFAIRSGAGYRRQNWQGNVQDMQYMGSTQARVITGSMSACKFVAGSNRIYVKAVTRSATDVITVNSIQVRAGL